MAFSTISSVGTPWAVTTTKRKSTPLSHTHPKRQRLSEPPDRRRTERKIKQQTLTQIDWIPSSRNTTFSDEEDDMDYIEMGSGNARSSATRSIRSTETSKNRPGLSKKNSTLTQMDFVHLAAMDKEYRVDDEGLGLQYDETDQTTLQNCHASDQQRHSDIPQMDGTCDGPRRKGRRRRTSIDLVVQDANLGFTGLDHQSAKKRRSVDGSSRPFSRRAAEQAKHKLSPDPDKNSEYCQGGLEQDGPPPTALSQPGSCPQPDAQARINQQERQQFTQDWAAGPRTPHRQKSVIPSSQSPESPPLSNNKKAHIIDLTTPRKSAKRQPLQQLSVNASRQRQSTKLNQLPSSYATASPTPKRKVCVLKLPQKGLKIQKSCIQDSQEDIYSIQPTSSSPRVNSLSERIEITGGQGYGPRESEVPSTSQSQSDFDENVSSSPPLEHDLRAFSTIIEGTIPDPEPCAGLDSKDVEHRPATGQLDSNEIHFGNGLDHISTPIPDLRAQSGQEAQDTNVPSDFGSPIPNDTQFNMELTRTTAYPQHIELDMQREDHCCPSHSQNSSPRSSFPTFGNDINRHPVRTPTFVHHSTTTTVPLNDVHQTFSSPSLPTISSHRLVQPQHSIRPASMPHQSQISTQDPTQNLPLLSSPVEHNVFGRTQEPERIIIKDSSSLRMPLVELPQYESEASQINVDFGLDDNEEEDLDLDVELDPSSSAPSSRLPVDVRSSLGKRYHASRSEAIPPQTPQYKGRLGNAYTTAQHHSPSSQSSSSPDPDEPNFTPGGHPTRARMKRLRRQGLIPKGYRESSSFVVTRESQMPAWYFEDPFEGLDLD